MGRKGHRKLRGVDGFKYHADGPHSSFQVRAPRGPNSESSLGRYDSRLFVPVTFFHSPTLFTAIVRSLHHS